MRLLSAEAKTASEVNLEAPPLVREPPTVFFADMTDGVPLRTGIVLPRLDTAVGAAHSRPRDNS